MKFKNFEILKNLITEQSRVELLLDKLTKPSVDNEGQQKKPLLTIDEFIKLIKADPTTRLNNVDISSADSDQLARIKAGKYVNWIIKHFLKTDPNERNIFIEDLFKINIDLKKYERFKNLIPSEFADINKIDPRILYQITKDFDLNLATTTKAERKKMEIHLGAKLVFDGPTWRVVKIEDDTPLGKEAAQFYGGYFIETRWCTSSTLHDHFDRHIKLGPLYVIYNPNDTKVAEKTGLPVERYQFQFEYTPPQFMDKEDQQIDLVEYFTGKFSELKDFFKPMFFSNMFKTDIKSALVTSLSYKDKLGAYISIYGLEDYFKALPEDITTIVISDKERSNVQLDVPANISRFKNLEGLTLSGVVKSIPDSICSLDNLKFMTLDNNLKLRSIPDCVADMKKFSAFNVENCPSLNLSDKITSEFTEFSKGFYIR